MKSSQNHVIKEMAAGAIGMTTASIILNPLDVVKVRIQNSNSASRSMVICAKNSVREAGSVFRGLILPGLTATIARDVLNGAFRVGLYKEIERSMFPIDSNAPDMVKKVVTGIFVGATGAGLWSHTDLVKTKMQLQSSHRPVYKSTWAAYRHVFATEGLSGLYRGVGPNMLRASIITTSHVGSYDYSKRAITPIIGDGGLTWIVCGFLSALVTTSAAAPIDLIRTRIMSQSGGDGHSQSPWGVARNILSQEGLRGFFRGWMPSFTRFGPHFTISWPLIELSRKYLFALDSF